MHRSAYIGASPVIKCVLQIRSHAAGALAKLRKRDLYQGLWGVALQIVCEATAGLHGSGTAVLNESGTLFARVMAAMFALVYQTYGVDHDASYLNTF